MSGFDANDFTGGIQPGAPAGNGDGGIPPSDPNAPAGAAPGGDDQQPPAEREGWIPRTRFDEVNSRVSQLQAENQRLAALEQQRQQLGRQLLGDTSQPEDPYTARVKEQMYQLFPWLKDLEGMVPTLKRVPDMLPQIEGQSEAFYQQLGTTHVSNLEKAALGIYGGDKLPNETKQNLTEGFISWISRDKALQQRYMAGDPSLAPQFMAAYQAAVLDPFKRQVLSSQQQRAGLVGRLPGRGPATAPIPGVKPPELKTEDDRHEAAFNALVNAQG